MVPVFPGRREIDDYNDIAGEEGRFRLELTMTNTGRESRLVRCRDPETGEIKGEGADVYPPYDGFFDNHVYISNISMW